MILNLSGVITPEETQSFHLIPFEVPESIRWFQVVITYDNQVSSDPTVIDGNVLDLGIFDPAGTESGSPGFRGWSGSDRLNLVIGESWATPPYRSGPIIAGTWHLLLAGYKVAAGGLHWKATITLEHTAQSQPAQSQTFSIATEPVSNKLPGWYRGDLHAHSTYSDGNATPAQIAELARARGLDFFGITDHNRSQSPATFVPQGPEWPLLIPGVEVTTYSGHLNV